MSQDRLMDRAWEVIQKRTFTKWCNNHLQKRHGADCVINDLSKDFKTGVLLMKLINALYELPMPKHNKAPKMRPHLLDNLSIALAMVKEAGVTTHFLSGENIADEDQKMILGMIWCIILDYQIKGISVDDSSAKEGLLLWCRKKTAGYKDVSVENFHLSFQDGLALCALIHKHRPDLLDYDSLSKSNPRENLQLAFDVAAKHLDVPQLLDVADIVDVPKPDERSMLTYVSYYYHVFSKSMEAENAGARIGKIIDFTQANDAAKNDYLNRARKLKEWIGTTSQSMNEPEFDGTWDGVQAKLGEFKDYKSNQKKPQATEKLDLESLFNGLQTKLITNNRPAFVPPEGLSPKDLDGDWNGLEKAEHSYNLAIVTELRKQNRIRALLAQFKLRTDKLVAWADSKKDYLTSTDYGDSVSAVQAKIKNHELFNGEAAAMKTRLSKLNEIADELRSLGYKAMAEVEQSMSSLNERWSSLEQQASDRAAALQEALKRQQEIEDMLLDFAKKAGMLKIWCEGAEEVLADPIQADSMEAVNYLKEKQQQFIAEKGSKDAEVEELRALKAQVDETGRAETTFSTVSFADVEQAFAAVASLIAARDSNLQAETAVQEANDALCVQFAEQAKNLMDFVKGENAKITATADIDGLRAISASVAAKQSDFDAVAALDEQLVHKNVLENPHTELTLESVKREWEALNVLSKTKQADIEKELLAKESSSKLPADQVREYKDCFDHFDRDRDGHLNRLEFGSCLKSLGQDVSFDEGGSLDALLAKVAPANANAGVTFDEFLGHMESSQTQSDSPDAIKEAFKVIAGDKDYVTEGDMAAVMPAEKVAYLKENMPAYPGVDGAYDFNAWTESCYSR